MDYRSKSDSCTSQSVSVLVGTTLAIVGTLSAKTWMLKFPSSRGLLSVDSEKFFDVYMSTTEHPSSAVRPSRFHFASEEACTMKRSRQRHVCVWGGGY